MSRKLNIGGTKRLEGWEIFNIFPGDHVDHVGNAVDLSRFPTGTFSEIYASHILEHLDFNRDVVAALREWHRALEPGGVLYISVPDMETLARLILDKERLNVDERFIVMCMLFGGHSDQHDYHLTGFTEDFLATFLNKAGFSLYKRVDSFNFHNDCSTISFKGELISLNVIALKS
jgi:predicted SAM-dependent methyltransferase